MRFRAMHVSVVLFVCTVNLAGTVRGADLKTFDDANLYAVQFLDAHEGWAVGDQGTVWHTMDGGTVWERQPTATRAMLTSIQMLNPREGWLSGRQSIPYNPGSTGIAMSTRDGGGKWAPAGLAGRQWVSGLRHIHFADNHSGWVVGESTDQHPTGLFATIDAGANWNAVKGPRVPGWTAAHFLDFEYAILGGHNRTFVRLEGHRLVPLRCDWIPGSTVRDIAGSKQRIWAVGDQAQIFFSNDMGRTWLRPRLNLPLETRAIWNFNAVSVAGDHVWVIGRPGSVVLHSGDGGATWELQKTGQSLPLYDLQFADERHGWAVGAMGTILATSDGGVRWAIQRPRQAVAKSDKNIELKRRAAVLWLTADGQKVPLSVVARYGGELGFYNVAFAATSPDLSENLPALASRPLRFSDAFRVVGGATAENTWRFPVRSTQQDESPDDLLTNWNRLHEGQANIELLRELVLAIRIWQPAVVVTDQVEASDAPARFVADVAKRAFSSAGDRSAFGEQVEFLGLAPHSALKLYARDDNAKTASVSHHAGDLGMVLGETFADAADIGMSKLHEEFAAVESRAAFTIVSSGLNDAGRHARLTQGFAIQPGVNARADMLTETDLPEDLRAAIRTQSAKKRNWLAIVDNPKVGANAEQFLGNLGAATADFSMQRAGQLVFEIGKRLATKGEWELAHNAFKYLLINYPEHPVALAAYRWLIAYQTSGEARLRAQKIAVIQQQDVHFVKPGTDAPSQTTVTGQRRVVERANSAIEWNAWAITFANHLKSSSPHLWADPQIQLCLAAARRRVGVENIQRLPETLLYHYHVIDGADASTRWRHVIDQEKWIFKQVAVPPKNVAVSVLTPEKPYLDGKLDDACWTGRNGFRLQSGVEEFDKQFTSGFHLRHDNEYLYIAAQCNYPNAEYKVAPVQRTRRDEDLSAIDRVELLIDVDRDYSTFYRLQIDQRGLVAEDCWGDHTWNPRWFVATSSDERGWQLEAAVPLSELSDTQQLTNEVWAVNVMRVIPGGRVLAWGQPAASDIRADGFTLLRFVNRDPRKSNVLKTD